MSLVVDEVFVNIESHGASIMLRSMKYRALAHLEIEEGQVIKMLSAMKSCLRTVLYSIFK